MHSKGTLVVIELFLGALVTICQANPVPKHGRIILGIAVEQAATAGVDYQATLRRAYGGDSQALETLFRVTLYMDGAATALNSGVLEDMLRQFGDIAFSSVLARQPRKVIERVNDDLDFGFAMHPKQGDWSRRFARTYRLGTHRYLKLNQRKGP
jgi:hypothetical protein